MPVVHVQSLPGCGPVYRPRGKDYMNDSKERRVKPEGGFRLMTVGAVLRCWQAYREGQIEFRDLRVWFAAQELVARRCMLAKGRVPSYNVNELAGLVGGVGGEHFRSSLRTLEALGLISWRTSRTCGHGYRSPDSLPLLPKRGVPITRNL